MTDTPVERRRGYPYVSISAWTELRTRFRRTPPRQVTVDYLQSVLGVSEKAAQNLLPQLRTLGLINADNSTTALTEDFRHDETYAAACDAMVQAVYPPALLEAHPDPGDDLEGVKAWFMRNAAVGEAAATQQARFLAMLTSHELPQASERSTPRPAKKTVAKKASPARAPAPRKEAAALSDGSDSRHSELQDPETAQRRDGPALHLDVQVHIAADASLEQIDAVFASMARHLYGRE